MMTPRSVTEEEEGIFSQMSGLQTQYQGLLARLLSKMGGATGQGRWEEGRLSEKSHKFQTESWEDSSSLNSNREDHHLQAGVTATGTIPTVTKLPLSTSHTLHPVIWQGDCWVTSAEVSSLNPRWHGYDLLTSMLQRKKLDGEVSSKSCVGYPYDIMVSSTKECLLN